MRRRVGKKFAVPPSPLDQEGKLNKMQPLPQFEQKEILKVLDSTIQKTTDLDTRAALIQWKTKMVADELKGDVGKKYIQDFHCWLLGRGKPTDHKRTFWGRENAARTNRQVQKYIDSLAGKRLEYALKLAEMAYTAPTTLNGFYLYFKYIVRSGIKMTKGVWDFTDVSYLDDWDMMRMEFEKPYSMNKLDHQETKQCKEQTVKDKFGKAVDGHTMDATAMKAREEARQRQIEERERQYQEDMERERKHAADMNAMRLKALDDYHREVKQRQAAAATGTIPPVVPQNPPPATGPIPATQPPPAINVTVTTPEVVVPPAQITVEAPAPLVVAAPTVDMSTLEGYFKQMNERDIARQEAEHKRFEETKRLWEKLQAQYREKPQAIGADMTGVHQRLEAVAGELKGIREANESSSEGWKNFWHKQVPQLMANTQTTHEMLKQIGSGHQLKAIADKEAHDRYLESSAADRAKLMEIIGRKIEESSKLAGERDQKFLEFMATERDKHAEALAGGLKRLAAEQHNSMQLVTTHLDKSQEKADETAKKLAAHYQEGVNYLVQEQTTQREQLQDEMYKLRSKLDQYREDKELLTIEGAKKLEAEVKEKDKQLALLSERGAQITNIAQILDRVSQGKSHDIHQLQQLVQFFAQQNNELSQRLHESGLKIQQGHSAMAKMAEEAKTKDYWLRQGASFIQRLTSEYEAAESEQRRIALHNTIKRLEHEKRLLIQNPDTTVNDTSKWVLAIRDARKDHPDAEAHFNAIGRPFASQADVRAQEAAIRSEDGPIITEVDQALTTIPPHVLAEAATRAPHGRVRRAIEAAAARKDDSVRSLRSTKRKDKEQEEAEEGVHMTTDEVPPDELTKKKKVK